MTAALEVGHDPREGVVQRLAVVAARMRAAGDLAGAAIYARAITELLTSSSGADAGPGAEVIDLEHARQRRGR